MHRRQDSKINYPAAPVINSVKLSVRILSRILWFIKYRGTENILSNRSQGMLIAANHQSYFDPFWIGVPVRQKLRFMAFDQAFDWFLIGGIIKYLGSFPVNLEGVHARKSWREGCQTLRDGAALVIFPEASRSFSDGQLLTFKSGAIRLAWENKVPILPVTVRGANRVWAQDLKMPRFFRRVEIIYHPIFQLPPKPPETSAADHLEKQTAILRQIIASGL